MNTTDKTTAMTLIETINAVEGFDPSPLAVDYADLNTGETRKRLPVMAQIAWFRLKYPEGRFTLNVSSGKDVFVATARVYKNYMDPVDCFLSEASASRGISVQKPTVSAREWAQTAALGIALRNAGFGLQFYAAGEGSDEPSANESTAEIPTPAVAADTTSAETQIEFVSATPEPAEDPLEAALKTPVPIAKFAGKTLRDLITLDPNALVWVANKFTGDPEISAAAKLICESSLEIAA